jgi:virulence-associated protein VagC
MKVFSSTRSDAGAVRVPFAAISLEEDAVVLLDMGIDLIFSAAELADKCESFVARVLALEVVDLLSTVGLILIPADPVGVTLTVLFTVLGPAFRPRTLLDSAS